MSSEPEEGAAGGPGAEPPPAGTAGEPRRLHPAGIAVLGVGSLQNLALPLGIAFLGGVMGGGGGQPLIRVLAFGVFGALLAAGAGLAGWLTTSWSVGAETIRLRTGLLSRKEVDVPLGRVQALDIVHGPLQRLFGVRGVHVQTAGGGKAGEIRLPAVAAGDVELLRDAIRGRRVAAVVDAAPLAERRLSRGDLLLAALTAGQLGVILPVLAVVAQGLQETWSGQEDLRRAGEEGLRLVPESAPEWILAALGLLLVAWLLSIAGAVLAFAGFTVARDDDRLRLRRGLLSRREATVPVARVQAVRVIEGLLRRPFGLVTVRAEVAGYAKEAAAAQTLFPLLRRGEVRPFLEAVLPELADDVDGLEGRAAPGAAALRPADRRRGARRRRRRLPPPPRHGAVAAARRRARRHPRRGAVARGRVADPRRAHGVPLPPARPGHRAGAGGAPAAARHPPDRPAASGPARRRRRPRGRRDPRPGAAPRRSRGGAGVRRAAASAGVTASAAERQLRH